MSSSSSSIHIFIRFQYATQMFTHQIKLFKYIVQTETKKGTRKKMLLSRETNKYTLKYRILYIAPWYAVFFFQHLFLIVHEGTVVISSTNATIHLLIAVGGIILRLSA
jgi:hypothetical protein